MRITIFTAATSRRGLEFPRIQLRDLRTQFWQRIGKRFSRKTNFEVEHLVVL